MTENIISDYIYLDTYTIQKDMRIRLPKIIEQNMNIVKGKTKFDIFMKNDKTEIILKVNLQKKES